MSDEESEERKFVSPLSGTDILRKHIRYVDSVRCQVSNAYFDVDAAALRAALDAAERCEQAERRAEEAERERDEATAYAKQANAAMKESLPLLAELAEAKKWIREHECEDTAGGALDAQAEAEKRWFAERARAETAIRERDEARREAGMWRARSNTMEDRATRRLEQAEKTERDLSAARSALATHETVREVLRTLDGCNASLIPALAAARLAWWKAGRPGLTPPTEGGTGEPPLSMPRDACEVLPDEARNLKPIGNTTPKPERCEHGWEVCYQCTDTGRPPFPRYARPTESTPSDTPEEPRQMYVTPGGAVVPGPAREWGEAGDPDLLGRDQEEAARAATPEAPGEHEEWEDDAVQDWREETEDALIVAFDEAQTHEPSHVAHIARVIAAAIDARVRLTEQRGASHEQD